MAKKNINEWPSLIQNTTAFSAKIRELYATYDKKPAYRTWCDDNRCCPLTMVVADFLKTAPEKLAFLDIPNICCIILQVERDWVDTFTNQWDGFAIKEPVKQAKELANVVKESCREEIQFT